MHCAALSQGPFLGGAQPYLRLPLGSGGSLNPRFFVALEKAGELVRQPTDFGGEGIKVARGVGKHGAEARVKFDGPGFLDDFSKIGSGDARSGKDEDAVAGGSDEFGEFGSALQGRFRACRSENSCGGGLDDRFERSLKDRSFVERAVKRYGQRAREV